MEIVFLGVNDVGMQVYEWLCDRSGVSVSALVTTKEQLSLVEELQPDMAVSVGYDHIVPPDVLSVPDEGCVNLHPAYLPYNRGKSPNVWSIVEGTPAGATLHYMDEGVDTGEIIAQKKVEKRFDDTGKDLHRRLEEAQFELFVETWSEIESGEVGMTAQMDEGTYHEQREFEKLCELDLDEEYTVKELLNCLRALTFPPFDNAFVEVDGEKYYVDVEIRHEDEERDEEPEGYLSSY
jgi:methionyl-tRNA formyltransferase